MLSVICGRGTWVAILVFVLAGSVIYAEEAGQKPQGPPPSPVQVAPVVEEMISGQVTMVGTTEPIARSTVAAAVR